jgi:hypothetical protein
MVWFSPGIITPTPVVGGGAAPVLENSGMVVDSTSVGATRTFPVTVPGGLSDSVIVFAVDWFNGTNSAVSSVTYNASATGITAIGTDQTANLGSGIDGMAMRRLLAPTSGTNDVVFTFDADQGGQDNPLAYWVYSGVNQTTPIDSFVNPNHEGSQSTYNGSLTTTQADCSLGFAIWDFNVSANGSVAGWDHVGNPVGFAEGWSLEDAGGAAEKTWTWTGDGSSKITVGAFAVAPV